MTEEEREFRSLVAASIANENFSHRCFVEKSMPALDGELEPMCRDVFDEVSEIMDGKPLAVVLVVALFLLESVIDEQANDSNRFIVLNGIKFWVNSSFSNHVGDRYENALQEIDGSRDPKEMFQRLDDEVKSEIIKAAFRDMGMNN